MGVPAGDFDRRITVEQCATSRDRAGDEIQTWPPDGGSTFALWAAKKDQRGFETNASQQLVRSADTVFEVRTSRTARAIFPETHRIRYDGKLYTIVSIQEGKERADTLQFLTSSRPDGRGARGREAESGE